jgi:hypothetical protein
MEMKNRMTGAGGLSSKLLTLMLVLGISCTANAVDNSIYIDQSGDTATINITQDGSTNRVKGILPSGNPGLTTDPATITGDGILVNVQQVGNNNTLNLGVNTTTASGGNPTTVNYSVSGNNNQGMINLNNDGQGTNQSTTLDITQTGGTNVVDVGILGANNSLTVDQSGGGATIYARINADDTMSTVTTSGGSGNEVSLNLTGNKGQADVTIVGGSNIVGITQSGGGTLGHKSTVNLDGSGNNVAITQGGTIDTNVNLKSVGSGNAFTINTHN